MRFGEFEIDEPAGELRRNGARIKLQDLPFRTLVVLLRRSGAVVSREELRAELWGADVYVDAEAGLNTAVAKLREALGDTADAPRFIETLPKRGYRFIGALTDAAVVVAPVAAPVVNETRALSRAAIILALAGVVLIGGLAAYFWRGNAPAMTIAVVRFHNETGNPELDRLAGSLTDAVVVSLARNQRYGVIGNSPLLRTDRIFQDVKKIGAALNVDYVLLGQLQTGDAGLVARTHFIRVADQNHLWADKIDLANVADPENRVTTSVTTGVAGALAGRPAR
jgi:DNA-binding winged helix-turn-helix (wHTH) protein/TolB-like protein